MNKNIESNKGERDKVSWVLCGMASFSPSINLAFMKFMNV